MGIMHKLLKRRDMQRQGLIMDLTKTKDNNSSEQIQVQVQQIEITEHDLAPRLATDDNQFTAEHIVQLCKFLAEKSKRNKITHKRLTNSPNKGKHQTETYQRESQLRRDNEASANSRLQGNNTEGLTEIEAYPAKHVLADKFPFDSNSCEQERNFNPMESRKYQCSQDKRDILLKIRHQIFERKRQRQLVEQQLDVWRPW